MKKSEAIFGLLRIPLDALAVLAALLLSFRLRLESIDLVPRFQLLEPPASLPPFDTYVTTFVIPAVLLFLVLAGLLSLYQLRATSGGWNEAGRIVIAALLWLVTVMGWFFLVRRELFYSRILLLHATLLIILFTGIARAAVILLQRAMLRAGFGVLLVVSLGRHPITQSARAVLERDRRYLYLGHLSDRAALDRLEYQRHLDLVIQTDPDAGSKETVALIDYCRSRHIGYGFLPPVLADVPHLLRVERLGLLPLIQFQPTPLDGWGRVLKRLFDLLVSVMLLLVLSPILLLTALVILWDTGRPVLYISRRVGEHGRRQIAILKFRSMVRDADVRKALLSDRNERHDGPLFKMRRDPRITRVGRFLRRFDLDELPQLLNVLRGEMSLVGPRPHLPEEVERYNPYQRRVFAVKPGMTGLAQISGRSSLPFEEEVRLDLRYVEEWSFTLDLWVLWRTVWVVLLEEGSEKRMAKSA
jgi:exopolysaccharide biosynthesis polyprenyl glycosylphosphotransferase